jgi:hypothetical protein
MSYGSLLIRLSLPSLFRARWPKLDTVRPQPDDRALTIGSQILTQQLASGAAAQVVVKSSLGDVVAEQAQRRCQAGQKGRLRTRDEARYLSAREPAHHVEPAQLVGIIGVPIPLALDQS